MVDIGKDNENKSGKFDYTRLKTVTKAAITGLGNDSVYKPLYQDLYNAVEKKDDDAIYDAQFKIYQKTENTLLLKINKLNSEYNASKQIVEQVEGYDTGYTIKTMAEIKQLEDSGKPFPDNIRILNDNLEKTYNTSKTNIPILESDIKLLRHKLEMIHQDVSNLVDIMNE